MAKKIEIKSLTKKDIEELSKRKEGRGIAFSLYLGVKAGRNFVSEANSVISNALKKIEEEKAYSKKEKKRIKEISDEMKNEIKFLKLPDETKSIIMFFDTRRTRKAYHIPVYIPSRFVIESDPYIHPLVKVLEKYPRYMVVVLERDKARFFSIFLDEIEQMSEIIQSDVPQRINAARAEWKGLRETKIQGHIRDHLHRHLKKVAEETGDYFKYGKKGFSHLVIGAHRELVEKFTEILGVRSRKKLIGSYHIIHGYNLNRIKEKSKEVINKHEKQAEAETIKNLFNRSNKEKRSAIIEINSVLENFYLRNIDALVIGKDYREAGYVCPECHYISSYMKSCLKCKSKMTKAGDIADEIIEEAVINKIKIKHLLYPHKEFDKFGIGAFLKSVT
jgi:peptide chain release factor subunit 1